MEEEEDEEKPLLPILLSSGANRLFRVLFVWSVSFAIHYIFFNY